MKVLIACEESQRVCVEFRNAGHEAYSCDMIEPSGGHLEWHILGDALNVLNPDDGAIVFCTMDGIEHSIDRWDLIIAHPPCTYLSNVATRHHSIKCTPLWKINDRTLKRIDAQSFFMKFATADCDKIAIENPIGVMSNVYRKPDQVINPYQFADSIDDTENYVTKATCLWLKGLPTLVTNDLPKPNNASIYGVFHSGKSRTWEDSAITTNRSKERSKTFTGIARAFAKQWG